MLRKMTAQKAQGSGVDWSWADGRRFREARNSEKWTTQVPNIRRRSREGYLS